MAGSEWEALDMLWKCLWQNILLWNIHISGICLQGVNNAPFRESAFNEGQHVTSRYSWLMLGVLPSSEETGRQAMEGPAASAILGMGMM